MRHRKASIKLNRTSSHRKSMFRNMVTSLFKYDSIRTTDAKAKELSRWADHIITLAKKGDLHSRRQALSIVREKNVVHKLFEEAKNRYGKRPGGHTRIVKIGYRPGDAARMSLVELIGGVKEDEKRKKAVKKKGETVKKEGVADTAEKQKTDDKEAKAAVKTKKAAEPKKKEAAKKKEPAKKKEAAKKKAAPKKKKADKKATAEVKKDKAEGKKKAVKAKKKAAPKKAKQKKDK